MRQQCWLANVFRLRQVLLLLTCYRIQVTQMFGDHVALKVWLVFQIGAFFPLNVFALDSIDEVGLTSQSIARNSLAVAEATNGYGYCYAAVAKALKPLGVELKGSSAFMARSQLISDWRFVGQEAVDVSQLRIGDIIVYDATKSHIHGHIAVYQGFETESSDHISQLTPFAQYGRAMFFRLKGELNQQNISNEVLRVAPDFAQRQGNSPILEHSNSKSNSVGQSILNWKQAFKYRLIRTLIRSFQ